MMMLNFTHIQLFQILRKIKDTEGMKVRLNMEGSLTFDQSGPHIKLSNRYLRVIPLMLISLLGIIVALEKVLLKALANLFRWGKAQNHLTGTICLI